MTKTLSKLTFFLCLTGLSAIALGQSNASPSATEKGVAVQKVAASKNNKDHQDETRPDCPDRDRRNKKKHEAKPKPSQQEQEFEKMLQGIYG